MFKQFASFFDVEPSVDAVSIALESLIIEVGMYGISRDKLRGILQLAEIANHEGNAEATNRINQQLLVHGYRVVFQDGHAFLGFAIPKEDADV